MRLVQGAWNQAFIDEMTAFNRGRYDDQVDAASSAYNKISLGRTQKQVGSYQG